MSLLSGLSLTTLATFGAIAAAGYLIVDATSKIRAEAEKRLKFETMISAEGNKQALLQKQSLKDFQEREKLAAENRQFSQFLGQGSINDLEARKRNLQAIISIDSTGDNSKIYQSEVSQINAQIDAIKQRNKLEADNSFNQRWEIWKKNQESAIEAEKRFQIEVEKGKNKVIELGKIQKSALDELYQKKNADNPFVSVFSEADESLKRLRENIKGLSEDMQRAAIASQQALNKNKLFETRIDNNLSILDLKETADKFRNPNRAEDNRKFIDNTVSGDISRGNFFPNFGGTYGSNLANKVGGEDKLTDAQKLNIYNVNQLKNLSDFNNPTANVNDSSLISRLARERIANPNENLSINERLQKQIKIINSDVSNESERAIADKRLLGISSTLDPSQISAGLREQVASSADREAKRKGEFEQKNYELERQKLITQEKLIKALESLTKVAEKKGLDGVNQAVEVIIQNQTGFNIDLGASGTMQDVADYYEMDNPRRARSSDVDNLFDR